jgi:hypothetical protein
VKIETTYPDALIRKMDKVYKVEFEYSSSNFIRHRHDPMRCDFVICWLHDYESFPLLVIALSNPTWGSVDVTGERDMEMMVAYWRSRAIGAEKRIMQSNEKYKNKSSSVSQCNRESKLDALLDYLTFNPLASYADIGRHLKMSKSSGENYTKQLVLDGKIVRNGSGWEIPIE